MPPPLPIPFSAILFDLDGTLVDNMMVHHRAWQQKMRELGHEFTLEEVRDKFHGVNHELLERIFGDTYALEDRMRISAEKEAAYRDIFAAELTERTVGGAMDFIPTAHEMGIPLAIATAGPEENAFFAIEGLGIRERLGHVVHSGMVTHGKPHPEAYAQAAEGIGVPLGDCLIFEDSVTGARAANRAGCPVVVITTTHAREEFSELDVAAFREDFRGMRLRRGGPKGFNLEL